MINLPNKQTSVSVPDVKELQVDTSLSPNLPSPDAIGAEIRSAEQPNFVEPKEETLSIITPPNNFVEDKFNQFGERMNKNKFIDVPFEKWLSQNQGPAPMSPEVKADQVKRNVDDLQKKMDGFHSEAKITDTKIAVPDATRVLKQTGIGIMGGFNDVAQGAVELTNATTRFLGMGDISAPVPNFEEYYPDTNSGFDNFTRSTARFLTKFLPISKAVGAATSATGATQAVLATGAYGFLFGEDQSEGIVKEFIKDNFDIAPDVIDFMNHKTTDNEFVRRLRNSANFATDAVAFEGIFHGLKLAKDIARGKNMAYTVLSNGDVVPKNWWQSDVAGAKKNPSPFTKQIGLTTEDIGKDAGGIKSFDMQTLIKNHTGKGGEVDSVKLTEELISSVEESIRNGNKVSLYVDNKKVDIVGIDNGMMKDQKGQRWGTMSLLTDPLGKKGNRIEIASAAEAGPQAKAEAGPQAKTGPQAKAEARANVLGKIQKDMQDNLDKIAKKAEEKQADNPDRMTQSHLQAVKNIKKRGMKSITELVDNAKENAPANDESVIEKGIAARSLSVYSETISKQTMPKIKAAEKAGNTKLEQQMSVELIQSLLKVGQMQDKLFYDRSTLGRGLNATKFDPSAFDTSASVDMVNAVEGMLHVHGDDAVKVIREANLIANNLSGIKVADKIIESLRKNVDLKKVVETLQTSRINYLLSGLPTHATNIISNTVLVPLRTTETVVARGITVGRGFFGDQSLAQGVQEGVARAEIQGYMAGLGKAVSIATKNIVNTPNVIKGTAKFEAIYNKDKYNKYNEAIEDINPAKDGTDASNLPNSTLGKQISYVLGHVIKGTPVGKMLSIEDDVFKGMHYMATMSGNIAAEEAILARKLAKETDPIKAEILKTQLETHKKNVKAMISGGENDEILVDSTKQSSALNILEEKAKADARYWTLNSDLSDQDFVSVALNTVGKGLKKVPVVRWFAPFYHVGANSISMAVDHTPVLGAIIKMGNLAEDGSRLSGAASLMRGGVDADTFFSKQVVGAGIMATSALVCSKVDEMFGTECEIGRLSDNKLSFKLGSFKGTIDKGNIVFKLIAASQDIMDIVNVWENEKGAQVAAHSTATLLAEMYTPTQLLEVMAMFSDLANSNKQEFSERFIEQVKNNALSHITPYNGLAKWVNTDIKGMNKTYTGPELHEDLIDEMVKKFKFTYMGDDAKLPPRVSLFGEHIPYLRTFGYQVSDSAHNLFYGENMNTPLMKELMSLTREEVMSNPANFDEYELNDTSILASPPRTIKYQGLAKKLTPTEYSKFATLCAGKDEFGRFPMTLKQNMETYIRDERYTKLPKKIRSTQMQHMVYLYRKAAEKMLYSDSREIQTEVKAYLEQLSSEYAGGTEDVSTTDANDTRAERLKNETYFSNRGF